MKIIDFLNKPLTKVGAQFVRYPNPDLNRRIKLLRYFNINKVLDVGANTGEYASTLRKLGFKGELISFEPVKAAYEILKQNAINDRKWSVVNCALGENDEESFINIAGNINSSSILQMLPNHLESSPESKYIGKEKIIIKKIDSIFTDYYNDLDNPFLKIDTQGFELSVLKGAKNSLSKIKGLQVELSISPLYEHAILYLEMIDLLNSWGFSLYSLENGFSNPQSGQLLQFDGIFFRNKD